ncbi:hypothetical protein SAMN04487819_101400 [Actinopolyspora alba]|uniref:Uncharacterized protein n=1 Tax=Actinopolyspora alba TaxID=673379 RepID=A0A1I1TZK4_9ACTN|nr:hypothetical protein [Actinopolyspora alba]SFD62788.1 hypothetical protein SAMN04487819_101400 [Actinopolyspora alba]
MSSFSERLRAVEDRYQQGAAEFERMRQEHESSLREARENYPPLTERQNEEITEYYRSGQAGAELRRLQLMVDRGEVTWGEIKRGECDPEWTEAYYASFEEGGRLLRAAVEGEPVERYLPQETPAEKSPAEEPISDDEYFENQSFLRDDRW